jgi:hypothetical protein
MIDNTAYELSQYLTREEESDRIAEERKEMIAERAKDRLSEGGDCYPWSIPNIFEALAQCSLGDEAEIGCSFNAARKLPDNTFSQRLVVQSIEDVVKRYWERTALIMEAREYER